MRQALPIILTLTTALSNADESVRPRTLPSSSILPHGSQLKGVMIPRHDEQHRLVGSVRAEIVTLINEQEISGENVIIDFFHNNGQPRAQINLALASFNQSQGIVSSNAPVAIDTESFHVRGTGMHYAFQQGDGFITGPATTWMRAPTETTMKTSTTAAIGATGLALLTQSVAIANPDAPKPNSPITLQETGAKQAQNETARQLEENQQVSEDAHQQVDAFLNQANLDKDKLTGTPTEAKPLEVNISEQDTVVSCDGGMYFNADKGLLVYMKNITVKDPRFALKGADEVQILLGTDDKESGKQESAISSFSQVESVIATGAVHIMQRGTKGKAPVEASGAIFSYRPKSGEITLSGGYPWVKQGNTFMRAKKPNLTLHIKKDGSFYAEGADDGTASWQMGGSVETD